MMKHCPQLKLALGISSVMAVLAACSMQAPGTSAASGSNALVLAPAAAPALVPLEPATQSANAISHRPVPPQLAPSDKEQALFQWHAVGTQIYACRSDEQGTYHWVFVAPQAELFDDKGAKVAVHGAGPHWAALDGSRIAGKLKTQIRGEHPGDIPWLLLDVWPKSGVGKLSPVTSIQRINTVGGAAPATGCSEASQEEQVTRQPYEADYVFFARQPAKTAQ